MRPGAGFNATAAAAVAPVAAAGAAHSAWHSPVPYLFGGLAAMLGLIAFALLILACSYWKLSGYLDGGAHGSGAGGGDDDGEKGSVGGAARPAAAVQEHVVVIMAGEERPTFLAMPSASRAAAVELGAMANPEASASALGGGDGAPELEKKIEDSPQLVGGGSGSESSGATSTALRESSQ